MSSLNANGQDPPTLARRTYKFRDLLNAPKRLLTNGDLDNAQDMPTRARISDITLEDVIAGKYLAPLSLRDFEDYLSNKVKASENLYFELWCRRYEDLYHSSPPEFRPSNDGLVLAHEYQICVATFFDPSSPLEVNVSADVRKEIEAAFGDLAAKTKVYNPGQDNFLTPEAFAKVRYDTNEMLFATFKSFLKQQSKSSSTARGWFSQLRNSTRLGQPERQEYSLGGLELSQSGVVSGRNGSQASLETIEPAVNLAGKQIDPSNEFRDLLIPNKKPAVVE